MKEAGTSARRFRDNEGGSGREGSETSRSTSGRKKRFRRRSRAQPRLWGEEKGDHEAEATDQVIEIPPGADLPFLRKMLSASSTSFVLQLHQQTRVRVSLGLSSGEGLRRPVVVLSGGAESTFSDCKSRIEELFHVNLERQHKFLRQFGADGSSAALPNVGQARASVNTVAPPVFVSKTSEGDSNRIVAVPPDVVKHLMTAVNRQALMEVTGADPEWMPDESQVRLRGSAEQVNLGTRALARVTTHCLWGVSESKILRLLQPSHVDAVLVRLSPMGVALRAAEKLLGTSRSTLSIGKDRSNDVVISDALISRQHCVLELDFERGAVYVINLSTNGAFLNGRRLPDRSQGKVLLSHGDELLLKDPLQDAEFGYVVNLVDHTVHVWEHIREDADINREHAERLRRRGKIGCGN